MKNTFLKTIVLFIFFLGLSNGFSQNTLFINFEYCNNSENKYELWNNYRIIKNDTIITEHKESCLKLLDGKYQIEYKTYFGWKKTNSFLLVNNINFIIDICIDRLENDTIDYYNLFIDSLKNGQSITITHNYSGCFNSGGEKIIITRIKDNYIVEFNKQKKKLKKKEIESIKKYEMELINLNTNEENVMCPAFSQNIIEFGTHKYEYSENCPKWRGFDVLKTELKLK